MATKILYGWYSPTQKKYYKEDTKFKNNGLSYSSHIYLDTSGNEVEVTEVSKSPHYGSNFKDVIHIGIITRWIRNINT
jgi:hypothetical protein